MYKSLLKEVTKETVLEAIKSWQYDVGEGFEDYFDTRVNIPNFMFWCLGKGYIDNSRFNAWLKNKQNKGYDWNCLEECLCGYESEFALFPQESHMSDEEYEAQSERGWAVIAEFIASNYVYTQNFITFLAGEYWSCDWEDIPGEAKEETYQRAIKILESESM